MRLLRPWGPEDLIPEEAGFLQALHGTLELGFPEALSPRDIWVIFRGYGDIISAARQDVSECWSL